MLYRIVQDIPGRLRLRCGRGLFDEEEALGVTQALCALGCVQSAEVHPANGSVLVSFAPAGREEVLSFMDALSAIALPKPVSEPTSDQALAISDNRFALEVSNLVAWRVLRRVFLPLPLRTAWTVLKTLPYLWKGLRSLLAGELKVEVLDASALLAAMIRGAFTDASSIMFLLELSDILCGHVEERAKLTLQEGLVARAESVWLVQKDGTDVKIPIGKVRTGQVLHMRAGTVLPIDGTVVAGDGLVDEASMTGEARLVHKTQGSVVFAGCALSDGDLKVLVTAEPGRARIDSIVRMVEQSSERKAEVESRAEHLADSLVPASFIAFFGILAVTRNIAQAMVVLMVDYSCAIKVSTPVAVMAAMQEAAEEGIVVKGGKYLEALAAADTIVFDKTGTLTEAAPEVEKVLCFDGTNEDEVLRLAACIEEHFPHSLARAIVREAKRRGLHHEDELHAKVNYVVAHGIATTVNGEDCAIGSAHFLFDDLYVPKSEGLDELLDREAPSASVVFLSRSQKLVGAVCVADPVRPGVPEILAALRAHGVSHTVMLTGDSESAARAIATRLGIDIFHAQVLPEDKAGYVSNLRRAGHTVIMVGDGINDSPALAEADVSIALSDATDIARAVADVTVLDDSLASLVTMRELSERLMHRIQWSYRFIVGYNTLLIAGGVCGLITLTAAAYLHNTATVAIAVANARPYLEREQAEGLPALAED